MPLAKQQNDLSIEAYLEGERQSEIRHEYAEGVAYAMAGASVNHNRVSRNFLKHLAINLPESCEVFSSDLLVQTTPTRYRYPDLVVLCDNENTEGNDQFVTQPVLIIEVLSKSTRQQDKGAKRTEYLSLPSLREYVLVEQDFVEVEVLRRSQGWRSENYYLGQVVSLESVGVELDVADLYERVDNADMLQFRAIGDADK